MENDNINEILKKLNSNLVITEDKNLNEDENES